MSRLLWACPDHSGADALFGTFQTLSHLASSLTWVSKRYGHDPLQKVAHLPATGLLLVWLSVSQSCLAFRAWSEWPAPFGQRPEIPGQVGTLAPDFELERIDGGSLRLSDLRVNLCCQFLATWCGPCVLEMPNIKSTMRNSPANSKSWQ